MILGWVIETRLIVWLIESSRRWWKAAESGEREREEPLDLRLGFKTEVERRLVGFGRGCGTVDLGLMT